MGTSNCRVPGPEAAVATRYYEGHRLSPGEMGSFMVCVLLQCPPSPWPLCHHLFFFFLPQNGLPEKVPTFVSLLMESAQISITVLGLSLAEDRVWPRIRRLDPW